MKLARTAIAYCGLLSSVLLSHFFGHGNFISAPSIIGFSILIIGALSISMPQELEGPHLALMALIAQVFGHFIFGGGAIGSSMAISHVAGGIVGYQLVVRFDQLICSLESLIRKILIPLTMQGFPFSKLAQSFSIFIHIERVKAHLIAATYSLRAPPRYIVN